MNPLRASLLIRISFLHLCLPRPSHRHPLSMLIVSLGPNYLISWIDVFADWAITSEFQPSHISAFKSLQWLLGFYSMRSEPLIVDCIRSVTSPFAFIKIHALVPPKCMQKHNNTDLVKCCLIVILSSRLEIVTTGINHMALPLPSYVTLGRSLNCSLPLCLICRICELNTSCPKMQTYTQGAFLKEISKLFNSSNIEVITYLEF